MNARAVARHYGTLTPEERFCLILAAGARGDKAEQDRLAKAGERIALSMPDHVPYADALDEVGLFVFLDLLEEAASSFDAWVRVDDAQEIVGDDEREAEEDDEAEAGPDTQLPERDPAGRRAGGDRGVPERRGDGISA